MPEGNQSLTRQTLALEANGPRMAAWGRNPFGFGGIASENMSGIDKGLCLGALPGVLQAAREGAEFLTGPSADQKCLPFAQLKVTRHLLAGPGSNLRLFVIRV